jgi:hypothetical protein
MKKIINENKKGHQGIDPGGHIEGSSDMSMH